RAGLEAARMGAHREAAVHYSRALRFAEEMPIAMRATLYAGSAVELFLTVQFDDAAVAQREAIRCFEELGDEHELATALSFAGQLLWQVGTRAEGVAACERALELLGERPCKELVAAHSQMAYLLIAAEDLDAAAAHAARAAAVAQEVDDAEAPLL